MAHLERIARVHSRDGLDIAPDLYELWLTSLIGAVSEDDPFYTESFGKLWHRRMQHGIDFMIAHY